MNRRPLKTRNKTWAARLAAAAVATGLSPNGISSLGILISLMGAWLILQSGFWLITAALTVQLRLLCNMLDGMVAIEHDRKSPLGDLFNEVPDRIEDSLFLVASGFACGIPWMGWLCALLAVSTAYLRQLGGSLGFEQDFCGPMAKPQRMFVLTLSLIAGAFFSFILKAGLAVIAIGTVFTLLLRLRRLAQRLEAA